MSETKGWLGWLMPKEHRTNITGIAASKQGAYSVPVWVARLDDPDGPLPGMRMLEQGYGTVEVMQPRVFDWTEGVTMWTVVDMNTRRVRHTDAEALSPTPRTRTVTVELDEDEVDDILAVLLPHAGEGTIRKLATALEDS